MEENEKSSGDEQNKILYDIIEEFKGNTLRRKINQTITKINLRGGTNDIQEGKLFEVLNTFYEIIEELYAIYITDHAKDKDYAQMVLYTDAMEHPISTPVRLAKELTSDHLLTKVKQAQNSGITIKFSDKLIIEFIHIRKDKDWKDEDTDSVLGGGGTNYKTCLRLLYFDSKLKKRSIIGIPDTGDHTCLGRALIVGKAELEYDNVRTKLSSANKSGKEKKLMNRWKQIYQRTAVNKTVRQQVVELYKRANWKIGKPCDLHMLKKFENLLEICVKIVSLKHQFDIIYKGNQRFKENTIYLCYSENKRTKIGHFDLIVNIKGFFSKAYYCKICDVSYMNMWDHRCTDIRDWCYACYNRYCKKIPNYAGICSTCKIKIRSDTCKVRHKQMNCIKNWKCQKCRLKYPRVKYENRFQNDSEMEMNHICYTYMCRECNSPVPEDHLCFIKKKVLKPKVQKFCFFDFETDQSSGEHVVNYIHARYFVSHLSEKEISKEAPSYLDDHASWKGTWEDMIFNGEEALSNFLSELITKKKFEGYTIIAHNLRGFDGIFILKELVKNNICPNVIVKGQKIMNMTVPGCNIRFIDSYNFLPMGLAKLPGAFGLNCGSKGYFPHFYNRTENWVNEEKPLPDVSFYGVDNMNTSEKKKFMIWYEEEKTAGKKFYLEREIAEYCKQDVNILTECCLAYRKLMCEETGCDPFAYLTCASVCSAVYQANFMPENTIARVPPSGYLCSRYSEESLEWLEYIRQFGGYPKIRHAGNSVKGEKKLGKYFVDGFDEDTKTVFEYYGCFFHGCDRCFLNQDMRSPVTRKLLKQSLKETKIRENDLVEMGYKVVSMWGCDWKREKYEKSIISENVKKLDVQKPLNPRDAFYGGRTECFKLSCSEQPIAYQDITSLYPWVNFSKRYPIGHPEIILCNFDESNLDKYFGFIQCKILPPRDLYIPVLPIHVGRVKKLVFPLCYKCAENFQIDRCCHSEDERALIGTWFSEEIKLAISKGYRIIKMYSIWHFKETTENLFADYVKTFYKKKLLSSKLHFSDEKELEMYIKEVEIREKINITNSDEFKENPGLRQLTKLMLNNLWGRFGMQENLSKSVFITRFEQFVKLLDDQAIDVQGVRVVSDTVAQVIYRAKASEFLDISKDTNIYIAVVTTAWARVRLYEELDTVQERVIYCDTDSVIYKKDEKESWNLKLGNFLGDMTDEIDEGDWIVDFVSGGPKNYAYRTHKGKTVVKIKGFTLDSVNAPVFSFENIKKVIINGLITVNDDERVIIPSNKIRDFEKDIERRRLGEIHMLNKNYASALNGDKGISIYKPTRIVRTRDWRVLKKPEQKLYSFCFDKRIILSNFDTVPFGYTGLVG